MRRLVQTASARIWTFAQVACAAAIFGGCAADRSFALVSVLTTEGEIKDVAQLLVDIENGPHLDLLAYPKTRTASLRLDATNAVTFSVSFKTAHHGTLVVGVTPVNAGGAPLGYGTAQTAIDVGHVTKITVRVVRGAAPPPRPGDGGVPDGGQADVADATPPPADRDAAVTCEPSAPATCGPSGTCFVACRPDAGAVGLCTAGGSGQPGQPCVRNEECASGTQCFRFSCGTQSVGMCKRLCSADGQCAGGRCANDVQCAGQATGFRMCSQACDPVGTATTGCAPGLHCMIFAGEMTDCDCRAPTQTGGNNAPCTDSRNCQPGFHCLRMSGSMVCRELCRLDGPRCSSGNCEKVVDPEYRIWGACVP